MPKDTKSAVRPCLQQDDERRRAYLMKQAMFESLEQARAIN